MGGEWNALSKDERAKYGAKEPVPPAVGAVMGGVGSSSVMSNAVMAAQKEVCHPVWDQFSMPDVLTIPSLPAHKPQKRTAQGKVRELQQQMQDKDKSHAEEKLRKGNEHDTLINKLKVGACLWLSASTPCSIAPTIIRPSHIA